VLGAVAHAEAALNDVGNAPARPLVAAKTPGVRSPRQQVWDLGALRGRQPGRSAWAGPGLERLHATLPAPLDPAADRPFAHAERARNVLLPPALLSERKRPLSLPFTLLVGDVLLHLSMVSCFMFLCGAQ
jgi:hypothetical protein